MSATTREHVAKVLRGLRTKASLTQAQLARRLRRSTTYVSKIELGRRGIELADVARWATACGFAVRLEFDSREGNEWITESVPVDDLPGDLGTLLGATLPSLSVEERELAEAVVRYLSRRAAE